MSPPRKQMQNGVAGSKHTSNSANSMPGKEITQRDVFLYVPNLVGYTRILLAGASLYYMRWHPKYCTILYIISCLLDAVDGAAARYFGQTSKFGAVLDMVTDRCTTSCLLCYLSSAYPEYTVFFQGLVSIDLASHYMHMYSTLNQGSSSHKKIPREQPWILRQYYHNNIVLFVLCAANELFFVAIYLLSFPPRSNSPPFLGHFRSIPLSYPYVLAALTFPLCLVKQIINVVQMTNAASRLVDADLDESTEPVASRTRSKNN